MKHLVKSLLILFGVLILFQNKKTVWLKQPWQVQSFQWNVCPNNHNWTEEICALSGFFFCFFFTQFLCDGRKTYVGVYAASPQRPCAAFSFVEGVGAIITSCRTKAVEPRA